MQDGLDDGWTEDDYALEDIPEEEWLSEMPQEFWQDEECAAAAHEAMDSKSVFTASAVKLRGLVKARGFFPVSKGKGRGKGKRSKGRGRGKGKSAGADAATALATAKSTRNPSCRRRRSRSAKRLANAACVARLAIRKEIQSAQVLREAKATTRRSWAMKPTRTKKQRTRRRYFGEGAGESAGARARAQQEQ